MARVVTRIGVTRIGTSHSNRNQSRPGVNRWTDSLGVSEKTAPLSRVADWFGSRGRSGFAQKIGSPTSCRHCPPFHRRLWWAVPTLHFLCKAVRSSQGNRLSAQEVVEFWAKRQILLQAEDERTIESRPLIRLTRISKRPSGHPFAEPMFSPTHRDAR